MGLVKAKLINCSGDPEEDAVEFHFNPTDIRSWKRNQWKFGPAGGKSQPIATFDPASSGQYNSETFILYFDTYSRQNPNDEDSLFSLDSLVPELPSLLAETSSAPPPPSVTNYTKKLWKMMSVVSKDSSPSRTQQTTNSEPPHVVFQYGKFSYRGVITDMTETLTLFLADGTPVRSKIDVTIQRVNKGDGMPNQNPSSGGKGGERNWMIQSGDTISSIAYRAYGDSNKWRIIAEANALVNPQRLFPGQSLIIPKK